MKRLLTYFCAISLFGCSERVENDGRQEESASGGQSSVSDASGGSGSGGGSDLGGGGVSESGGTSNIDTTSPQGGAADSPYHNIATDGVLSFEVNLSGGMPSGTSPGCMGVERNAYTLTISTQLLTWEHCVTGPDGIAAVEHLTSTLADSDVVRAVSYLGAVETADYPEPWCGDFRTERVTLNFADGTSTYASCEYLGKDNLVNYSRLRNYLASLIVNP